MDILIWCGIFLCLSQSAMFSGLNLAFFSISKMRLEVEKRKGNKHAERVMAMRDDSNFLLTTILWGNVGINVLLTLLSNRVLAGIAAFMFSTVFITLVGEIIPQAYFSRQALKFASFFSPVLRMYQFLLYPFSKPSALLLDYWLGKEGMILFREKDFREVIKLHIAERTSDITYLEGRGALNFLALDDLSVIEEGENVDQKSIITLEFEGANPQFPPFTANKDNPFIKKINESGKKWVILVDAQQKVQYVLDSDAFLRSALCGDEKINPIQYCHRPIVIENPRTPLEEAIIQLNAQPTQVKGDVIEHDIILLWSQNKKVITGSDILGRLLQGIVTRSAPSTTF